MPFSKEEFKKVTQNVIKKNQLIDLMIGKGHYYITQSEFDPVYKATEYTLVLNYGIYSLYDEDKSVKTMFEDALVQMADTDAFLFYVAIAYVVDALYIEMRNQAPFCISREVIERIGKRFEQHKIELENGIIDTNGYHHQEALKEIVWWNKLIKRRHNITMIKEINE